MNGRMIIPCAGLGTRMNMPLDQSKELLLYMGRHLIDLSLSIAKRLQVNPLVITRKEKKDLIQYCLDNDIEIQIIEVEGEWADTVLKSKPYWEENNLLMLPDTIFNNPYYVMQHLRLRTEIGIEANFAVHKVEDSSKWGVIKNDVLYEKPDFTDPGLAWGAIGFKGSYGEELFSHCQKGKSLKLNKYSTIDIENFRDLTRTGKIE